MSFGHVTCVLLAVACTVATVNAAYFCSYTFCQPCPSADCRRNSPKVYDTLAKCLQKSDCRYAYYSPTAEDAKEPAVGKGRTTKDPAISTVDADSKENSTAVSPKQTTPGIFLPISIKASTIKVESTTKRPKSTASIDTTTSSTTTTTDAATTGTTSTSKGMKEKTTKAPPSTTKSTKQTTTKAPPSTRKGMKEKTTKGPPSTRKITKRTTTKAPPSTTKSTKPTTTKAPPSTRKSTKQSTTKAPPLTRKSTKQSTTKAPPSTMKSTKPTTTKAPPSNRKSTKQSTTKAPPATTKSTKPTTTKAPPSTLKITKQASTKAQPSKATTTAETMLPEETAGPEIANVTATTPSQVENGTSATLSPLAIDALSFLENRTRNAISKITQAIKSNNETEDGTEGSKTNTNFISNQKMTSTAASPPAVADSVTPAANVSVQRLLSPDGEIIEIAVPVKNINDPERTVAVFLIDSKTNTMSKSVSMPGGQPGNKSTTKPRVHMEGKLKTKTKDVEPTKAGSTAEVLYTSTTGDLISGKTKPASVTAPTVITTTASSPTSIKPGEKLTESRTNTTNATAIEGDGEDLESKEVGASLAKFVLTGKNGTVLDISAPVYFKIQTNGNTIPDKTMDVLLAKATPDSAVTVGPKTIGELNESLKQSYNLSQASTNGSSIEGIQDYTQSPSEAPPPVKEPVQFSLDLDEKARQVKEEGTGLRSKCTVSAVSETPIEKLLRAEDKDADGALTHEEFENVFEKLKLKYDKWKVGSRVGSNLGALTGARYVCRNSKCGVSTDKLCEEFSYATATECYEHSDCNTLSVIDQPLPVDVIEDFLLTRDY